MDRNSLSYFARHLARSLVLLALFLAGCSNQATNGPETGVENYLQALVDKNEVGLINAACASWEENARQELRTFDAVDVQLEGVSCKVTGQDSTYTLISCDGKIVANYGNEILEIDLAERTFQVAQDGGEWRMCGYH